MTLFFFLVLTYLPVSPAQGADCLHRDDRPQVPVAWLASRLWIFRRDLSVLDVFQPKLLSFLQHLHEDKSSPYCCRLQEGEDDMSNEFTPTLVS